MKITYLGFLNARIELEYLGSLQTVERTKLAYEIDVLSSYGPISSFWQVQAEESISKTKHAININSECFKSS